MSAKTFTILIVTAYLLCTKMFMMMRSPSLTLRVAYLFSCPFPVSINNRNYYSLCLLSQYISQQNYLYSIVNVLYLAPSVSISPFVSHPATFCRMRYICLNLTHGLLDSQQITTLINNIMIDGIKCW